MREIFTPNQEPAERDYDRLHARLQLPEQSRINMMIERQRALQWFDEFDKLVVHRPGVDQVSSIPGVNPESFEYYWSFVGKNSLLPRLAVSEHPATFRWDQGRLGESRLRMQYVDRQSPQVIALGRSLEGQYPAVCILDPSLKLQEAEVWLPRNNEQDLTLAMNGLITQLIDRRR
jgi:hypothetical protein